MCAPNVTLSATSAILRVLVALLRIGKITALRVFLVPHSQFSAPHFSFISWLSPFVLHVNSTLTFSLSIREMGLCCGKKVSVQRNGILAVALVCMLQCFIFLSVFHFRLYFIAFIDSKLCLSLKFSFLYPTLANVAAAAGGFIYFMSYLPYLFLWPRYDLLSHAQKVSACLISNVAMAMGAQLMGMFEGKGKRLI